MKDLYLALQAQIKSEVPEIKMIDLQNGQLADNFKMRTLFFPAVFIEFASVQYEPLTQGVDEATVRLVFFLAQDVTGLDTYDFSVNQNEALAFFDLQQKLHRALQGFQKDFFTPLMRLEEKQDTNYSNIYAFATTYETKLNAISAWVGFQQTEQLLNFQINADLDIQNFQLRT